MVAAWTAMAFGGASPARPQGYPPELAAEKMRAADGLRVTLFASEPDVRQAILVKCDDRGRLWTIQYLQYPSPAGLTRVAVDRWSRTIYDRVPEPPPFGPRGADRVTILEDTDGDGCADRFKDFIAGLNLATGLEFGHGGVYVLNVPYLLFYPDRDRNDVPDSDPRVLLSGFGMEDAQALANHLTWGPDGWLYGVNGSTTTCRIRGIEFQQGVWRYHPLDDRFELFCEGGGNTFGLTFDEDGELLYSTNDGPFVHAIQGGYFYKSFGKHGPLHNQHAYHHLPHVVRDQSPGGPPTGGTLYLADAFPAHFRGTFIAGDFLGHTASWWTLQRDGSTYRAAYGGVLVDSQDTWCGPTDMCLGPDGAMYMSDFHDQRTAHPDPDANWDRSNGRIFRIEPAKGGAPPRFDLHALSSSALVELLEHRNVWFRDRARVELASRRDASVTECLQRLALQREDGYRSLAGLWALHAVEGLDNETARALLGHPHAPVRSRTVRLVCDQNRIPDSLLPDFLRLAETESDPRTLAQLAASARRLDSDACLPIVERLVDRDVAAADERIEWLIWWAIEASALDGRKRLVDFFGHSANWENLAVVENALRLVRRYAAEGTAVYYDACVALLDALPAALRCRGNEALAQGLDQRAIPLREIGQGGLFEAQAALPVERDQARHAVNYDPVAGRLLEYIEANWQANLNEPLALRIALAAGLDRAYDHARNRLALGDLTDEQRIELLELMKDFGRSDVAPLVLSLVRPTASAGVRAVAIDVLSRLTDETIAEALLDRYEELPDDARHSVRDLVLSRPSSAALLLEMVDSGRLPADEIPVDQLRRVALHRSESLDALVRKHWGNIGRGTPEEKLADMRRLSNDLRAGKGDLGAGKALFAKHCGTCHVLFGEGNRIGPDLTSANRGDLGALLANIVDPGSVVRRDYLSFVVETTSGQILTGLIADEDAASVTVLDAENRRIRLPRSEVAAMEESPVSLMPDNILNALEPQELRDLFSYLQHAE
jgi:putative membrane-bound dehydrogenase-like protein